MTAAKHLPNSDLVPGLDFGYSYDGMGNRLLARRVTPALTTGYTPDAMNRYETITTPGGDDILVRSDVPVTITADGQPTTQTTAGNFHNGRATIDNDPDGAWTEINVSATGFNHTGHRWIPPATVSPHYDTDGNRLNDGRWSYTWDAMNRLTGLTPTANARTAGVPNETITYAYDHLGRRIGKKVVTTTGETSTTKETRYLFDNWNVIAEFTVDNGVLVPSATYLWSQDLSGSLQGAGGVGGLHSVGLLPAGSGASVFLPSYDANGNIIAWTDTSGRVAQRQDYDPFGNLNVLERHSIHATTSARLTYGFSTKPLEVESGFHYFGYRFYDGRNGRWLCRDPIGVNGGLNLYGFVGNHGVGRIDFLGLQTFKLKIVGPASAVENNPQTRAVATFVDGEPEWVAKGVNGKDIAMPKNLARTDKTYEKLTLFLITANQREAEGNPADKARGIYTSQVGSDRKNAYNVYLTQKVEISVDAKTGVISAQEATGNRWEWDGPGAQKGDYIFVGSILVVIQPKEKNKAKFDYYGIGGWHGKQCDPAGPFKCDRGPLEGQRHATEETKNLYATGTGFFGEGVPDGGYPEVVYTPHPPQDPHRNGKGANGRMAGPLGKVSLSLECIAE